MTDDTHIDRASLVDSLRATFSVYKTPNLHGVGAEAFEAEVRSKIGLIDAKSEAYRLEEIEAQRDLSVKFYWGHNHDFGSFNIAGRMADRHLEVMADFVTLFDVSIETFENKDVFDIGCWTGGTTLLLAALGSRVVAVEEVKKYAATASYLTSCFAAKARVEAVSVYQCNHDRYRGQFDIAYFPGVIYHLTDPLLALRILFNSLRDGGLILVESEGLDSDQPYCRFDGSGIIASGEKESLNRGGWNWFIPSASALARMMSEAGFDDVETEFVKDSRRVYGIGRKRTYRPICRAGLSVSDID